MAAKTLIGLLLAVAVTAGCSTSNNAKPIEEGLTPAATATQVATVTSAATATAAATATSTPPPAKIDLLETGFTSYADSSGNIIGSWAAVLRNTGATPADNTKVTAIFYDAAGVVLKTDVDYAALLLSGDANAVGSTYVSLTAKPAKVEVRISDTKWEASPVAFKLAVTEVVYAPDRFSPQIRAKVANTLTKDINYLGIVCMMVESDGRYSAIGTAYLELLPAGATGVATCSLDSRMVSTSGATPRLFVNYSSITAVK